MNNESPLLPQGSFLDQKNKGRARVKIAVFIVLAIHGVGLMALLMQGCQKAPDTKGQTSIDTNTPVVPTFQPTNAPVLVDSNPPPPALAETNMPPVTSPETTPAQPPAGAVTQHKIAKGDTFAGLAKNYKVSVRAIQEANPGVDPAKLRIDQVIQIPAPAAAAAPPPSGGMGTVPEPAGSGQTYKVKSGDSLTKIAGQFGVSVKALRAANGLRTDRIRVGQVLKIPVKSGSNGASTSAPPVSTGQ